MWIAQLSDRYLITFFIGLAAVGWYGPAYMIGELLCLILFPVILILSPRLMDLYDQKKHEQVRTNIAYCIKYFLIIAIGFVFGANILSKQILLVLTTKTIAENGFLVVPIAAISFLLYGTASFLSIIFSLAKKTKIPPKILGISAATNFTLNILLIPLFGIIGAAIATLIGFGLYLTLVWQMSQRYLQIKIKWMLLLKCIVAGIMMTIPIYLFDPSGLLGLLMRVTLGAVSYLTLVYCLGVYEKKEIRFFKKMLRKIFYNAPHLRLIEMHLKERPRLGKI
jgi:O-antigen/teichoic acid export membrane protein